MVFRVRNKRNGKAEVFGEDRLFISLEIGIKVICAFAFSSLGSVTAVILHAGIVDDGVNIPSLLVRVLEIANVNNNIALRVNIAGVTVIVDIGFLQRIGVGENIEVRGELVGGIVGSVEIDVRIIFISVNADLVFGIRDEGDDKADLLGEERLLLVGKIGVKVTDVGCVARASRVPAIVDINVDAEVALVGFIICEVDDSAIL